MSYPIILDWDYQPYIDVDTERTRAHEKHGANGNSREDARWDNAEWLPILTEELGEAAHELTYDAHGDMEGIDGIKSRLRKELVQVAAMAIAWIESIDKSEFRPN